MRAVLGIGLMRRVTAYNEPGNARMRCRRGMKGGSDQSVLDVTVIAGVVTDTAILVIIGYDPEAIRIMTRARRYRASCFPPCTLMLLNFRISSNGRSKATSL